MSKIIFSILIFGVFIFFSFVSAQTVPNLQSVIKQLQEQINLLNQQVLNLQSRLKETEKEVETVKAELKLTKSIKKGESSDEVKQLQEFLKQFPDIYPEGIVTGFFGSLTENAVKRFQEKHGIESIGIVGPKTIQKLNEFSVSTTPVIPAVPAIPASLSLPLQPASPSQPIVIATPAIPAVPGLSPATPATPAIPATPASPSAVKTPIPTPTSIPTSTPAYNTRPVISSVSASSITSNSVVISWITDVPATGFVNYGNTTDWRVTPQNNSLTTQHSFTISNLAASTLYNYRVYSHNAYGDQTDLINGLPPNHTFITLSGSVSCSSINLVLNGGKTTYVKGVDNVVNYTWTCTPGGSADVNIGIQKPGGWISLNTATNSSTQTLSIDISGDSYPTGVYRLEACFNVCGSIVAGQTFSIVANTPTYTPTPTPTQIPGPNNSNLSVQRLYPGQNDTLYSLTVSDFDGIAEFKVSTYRGINIFSGVSPSCLTSILSDEKTIFLSDWPLYGYVTDCRDRGIQYSIGASMPPLPTPTPTPTPTPVQTSSVSFSPSTPATANILDALKTVLQNLNNLLFQLR